MTYAGSRSLDRRCAFGTYHSWRRRLERERHTPSGNGRRDATMADLPPGRWRSAESSVDVPRPAGRRASLV